MTQQMSPEARARLGRVLDLTINARIVQRQFGLKNFGEALKTVGFLRELQQMGSPATPDSTQQPPTETTKP